MAQPTPVARKAAPAISPDVLRRVLDMRQRGDPLLTDTLLAYPEDQEHRSHHRPREALLALADILHSHDDATTRGREAGARLDDYMTVQPARMACLLQVIADQMDVMFISVDVALALRDIAAQGEPQ